MLVTPVMGRWSLRPLTLGRRQGSCDISMSFGLYRVCRLLADGSSACLSLCTDTYVQTVFVCNLFDNLLACFHGVLHAVSGRLRYVVFLSLTRLGAVKWNSFHLLDVAVDQAPSSSYNQASRVPPDPCSSYHITPTGTNHRQRNGSTEDSP